MQKLSTGSRVFKCQPNETVTLTFTGHNTDVLVTYSLDDGPSTPVVGDSLSFEAADDLTILRVLFHFNGQGGSYDVALRGSAGGAFPDPPRVLQTQVVPPSRRYAFTR
jgi:hypothetical protein